MIRVKWLFLLKSQFISPPQTTSHPLDAVKISSTSESVCSSSASSKCSSCGSQGIYVFTHRTLQVGKERICAWILGDFVVILALLTSTLFRASCTNPPIPLPVLTTRRSVCGNNITMILSELFTEPLVRRFHCLEVLLYRTVVDVIFTRNVTNPLTFYCVFPLLLIILWLQTFWCHGTFK